MTNEKILEVLAIYDECLRREGYRPLRAETSDAGAVLNHCLWMVEQTRLFVADDRREKAFRWLGFVQGVLWDTGVYSIDELKTHNMPPSERAPDEAFAK